MTPLPPSSAVPFSGAAICAIDNSSPSISVSLPSTSICTGVFSDVVIASLFASGASFTASTVIDTEAVVISPPESTAV